MYLREHPLCAMGDRAHAAEVVDHITPVNGEGDPLFWLPSNHQPLCRHHHEQKHGRAKAHGGDSAGGRHGTVDDGAAQGNVDGGTGG